MSYTFLLEQGEESWAESFSGIPASVLSRLTPTAEKSCSNDSETGACQSSQSGMMCGHSMEGRGGGGLMLLPEGSHARTLALQVRGPALTEKEAAYGEKCGGSFAIYDLATCLWKTPQRSLLGGWETFYQTWPSCGMMLAGQCFQPAPWVIHTHGKECSFWPTPIASDWNGSGRNTPRDSTAGQNLKDFLSVAHRWLYVPANLGEGMMGWPIDWSAEKPLEMAKFQQWLNSHGRH